MTKSAPSNAPLALFAGHEDDRADWGAALEAAARAVGFDLRVALDPAAVDPSDVDHLLYAPWPPGPDMPEPTPLGPFDDLAAIHCLWAGVETLLVRDDLPDGVPILRMIEPGLSEGMRDYCVAFAMRALLDLDRLAAEGSGGVWRPVAPSLARHKRAGVLGLGALGTVVAGALAQLGFQTAGWSRSPKHVGGVEDFCGAESLDAFLARTDILVVLAPLTDETRGLLDARRLAQLPDGAHIINAARGPILDETALLAEIGRLGGAVLDVFDEEPLPPEHGYWAHPKIVVTPHVASVTRPETAAESVVRDILALRRGETPLGLVDPSKGY